MRVTDTHVYFWGSYLSNFYIATFKIDVVGDYEFLTSEHAFMAYKALYFGDHDAFDRIVVAPEARIAKKIGREVQNYAEALWSEHRYDFMHSAVYNKFKQNILIREQLLETGNRILVEASPLDRIWGVGLHEDDDKILDVANWQGENLLGKVLMSVRRMLSKESLEHYEDA